MNNDWTPGSLGDLVEFQRGYDLPTPTRRPGSVPVIGSFGVTGKHDVAARVGPGVAIGRSGASIGTATWVPCDYWPLNTCLFVSDFKGNDPRWVFHLLNEIDFTKYNSGSAQPSLNRNYLTDVSVAVPSRSEQRAIAEVLGALDDKIDANSRIIARAKAIARALLDSKSQDAPRMHLGGIVDHMTRGVAPMYSEADDLIVLNQKCVRDQYIDLGPARRTARMPSAEKLLRRDDLLVNSTGYGTLGRVARWTQHEAVATVDSHITIVRFDGSKVDPVCAGLAVAGMEDEIEQLAEGSTGQTELKRDLLAALQVKLPNRGAQHELRPKLRALDDLDLVRRAETERLVEARDNLLPPLMSGKIRVRDAATVVEDVL